MEEFNTSLISELEYLKTQCHNIRQFKAELLIKNRIELLKQKDSNNDKMFSLQEVRELLITIKSEYDSYPTTFHHRKTGKNITIDEIIKNNGRK